MPNEDPIRIAAALKRLDQIMDETGGDFRITRAGAQTEAHAGRERVTVDAVSIGEAIAKFVEDYDRGRMPPA